MGRNYTGAATVSGCAKLDIRFLVRKGFIKNGEATAGKMEWTHGGSVGYFADLTDGGRHINLFYTSTDGKGNITKYDYNISICSIPSNLGKGEVLYFICPVSGKRCQILYNAYNSGKWQARDTFCRRIYYNQQICSKRWLFNSRYFASVDRVNDLQGQRRTDTYRGVKTKRALALFVAKNKKDYFDYRRTLMFGDALDKLKNRPASCK